MTPAIQFRNVTKRFGQTVALDQVSFDVPAGTVCALLGANGAGKSTAIRIMLGLEQPEIGGTRVLGMDSQSHALEIRSRVGYVADKPPLYDWMSIDEIGWFAAGFYPADFQFRYRQLTQRFGLDASQKVKNLSKGTRAKVALSLALAHQPPLLILDEPTSGLDPLVRREFLESMIDIAAEGRTVFLSSHQVAEVERVADVVIILSGGKLVCMERLDDLKNSVSEVLISLPSERFRPPVMPGNVLAHVPHRHEHQFLVRELNVEQLQALCIESGLPAPQVRRPGLEDILLAMLRESRQPVSGEVVHDPWTTPAVAAEGEGSRSQESGTRG